MPIEVSPLMVRHQGRNIYQFFSQGLRSAVPLTRPRSAAVHLAGHFSVVEKGAA